MGGGRSPGPLVESSSRQAGPDVVRVRHYHVIERQGTTDRVLATFASAFQAGRDMALRERAQRSGRRDVEDDRIRDRFPSATDMERDAAQVTAAPASISYVECSCSVTEAAAH